MNLPGLYNRRVTLQKPANGRGAFNEPQTVLVPVVANLPAFKSKEPTGGKEGLELDKALRSEIDQEWKVRYFGSEMPKSNWVLIDEYGIRYQVISPATEIGKRQGWVLKTKVVE